MLINKYLNQLITPSEFRIEFLKMEKQDGTKANKILQDYQQLSVFSLVDNLEEFSNIMGQISDLCLEVRELGYGDGLSKDEFYYSVNNLYLQLKKSLKIIILYCWKILVTGRIENCIWS